MYNDGYAQVLGNLVLDKYLYEEQYQSKLKPGILYEAGLNYYGLILKLKSVTLQICL